MLPAVGEILRTRFYQAVVLRADEGGVDLAFLGEDGLPRSGRRPLRLSPPTWTSLLEEAAALAPLDYAVTTIPSDSAAGVAATSSARV